MKKKYAVLVALLGCTVSLVGCGGEKIEIESRTEEDITINEDITYDPREEVETNATEPTTENNEKSESDGTFKFGTSTPIDIDETESDDEESNGEDSEQSENSEDSEQSEDNEDSEQSEDNEDSEQSE